MYTDVHVRFFVCFCCMLQCANRERSHGPIEGRLKIIFLILLGGPFLWSKSKTSQVCTKRSTRALVFSIPQLAKTPLPTDETTMSSRVKQWWRYPHEVEVPDPRTNTKCGNQQCSRLISANGYVYGSKADTSQQRVVFGQAGYRGWCNDCKQKFEARNGQFKHQAATKKAKYRRLIKNATTDKERTTALARLKFAEKSAAETVTRKARMARGEIPASFYTVHSEERATKAAARYRSTRKGSTPSLAITDTSQDVAVGQMDDMEDEAEDDSWGETDAPSEDPTASYSDLGSTSILTGAASAQQWAYIVPAAPSRNAYGGWAPDFPYHESNTQQQSSANYTSSETAGYSSQTSQQRGLLAPPGQRGLFATQDQRDYRGQEPHHAYHGTNPRQQGSAYQTSETSAYAAQTSQGLSYSSFQTTATPSSRVASTASYSQSEFQTDTESGQHTSYIDSEMSGEDEVDEDTSPQVVDDSDLHGNFRVIHPQYQGMDMKLYKPPAPRVAKLYEKRTEYGNPVWVMKPEVARICTGGVRRPRR